MDLPDHGRNSLNDFIRAKMIKVAIGHGQGAVSQLPLYDAQVDSFTCEDACSRVTEPVDMDPLSYAPEYRVTSGQFTHIASVDSISVIRCEEETLFIVGPGGYPRIEFPYRVSVNPNHPTLTSLSFQYSDGTIYRIDVRDPKVEDFATAKLSAECEKKNAPIPTPKEMGWERSEELAYLRLAEHFRGK